MSVMKRLFLIGSMHQIEERFLVPILLLPNSILLSWLAPGQELLHSCSGNRGSISTLECSLFPAELN